MGASSPFTNLTALLPSFAVVPNGARRLLRVMGVTAVDPSTVSDAGYLGAGGVTQDQASATDLGYGASAYDLAVANGSFSGTLAEWLASLPGKPRRIEKLTGTLGAGGASTVTFATPFVATPLWIGDNAWSGNQVVMSYASAGPTATSITVKAKRSKGTLLLTAGPFEDAAAGDPYSIIVIGN